MKSSASNSVEAKSLFVVEQKNVPTIQITQALLRQKRVICMCVILGGCLAALYWQQATVTYTTKARIMVNQRDSALVNAGTQPGLSEDLINEDILANHIELLSSRKNVKSGMERAGLLEMKSLVAEVSDDADVVDYVIDHLKFERGGRGASKAARTMLLTFQHTNSTDAKLVLDCVIAEYLLLIDQQFRDSLSVANDLIIDAQAKVQSELDAAQQDYLDSRRSAPVLFTGAGSSNVFVEQYKTLSNQLVELEIQETTIQGRLVKVSRLVEEYSDEEKIVPIEALGVIDTDSLNRLGVFANLRADSTLSTDFQMDQPERQEEARAQYSQLLRLMLEKQRLESDFGAEYPDVKKLQTEIDLVKQFLEDNKVASDFAVDEPQLTSRQLLDAYAGFMKSELSSLEEQQFELKSRIEFAEQRAQSLVHYELRDELLKSRIDRNQQLFDGLVEQLRSLDIAGNVDGLVHELLESPRPGIKVWPKLSIVAAAGLMIGLLCGIFAALINDQLHSGFQTAREIDEALTVPILGYVSKLPIRRGKSFVELASAESEDFRMLRAMLLTDVRSGRLGSLTATSASPGDGKSTILLNIAASFAGLQMPVVMVEADMRRPTLRGRLNLKNKLGLSDILSGNAAIEDALCETEIPNLSVIHAGSAVDNPAELLQSESFETLMKELKCTFTLTVVDVGPVLAVSDPLVVAASTDGALLIVRPSVDTRQQVIGAAEMLRARNVKLLGAIVNSCGSSRSFHRGRYGYSSGYHTTPVLEKV